MAEKIKKKPTGEKPATSRRTSATTRSARPLAEAPAAAAETAPVEPKVQAPTVDLLAPVKKVRKLIKNPKIVISLNGILECLIIPSIATSKSI